MFDTTHRVNHFAADGIWSTNYKVGGGPA